MNAAEQNGAKRLEGMYFSPIRQVMEKVAKVREAGHPVISLSAGEPDFNTPNLIKEKTIEALLQNETHYAPNRGTLGLRTEIAKYLRRNFDLNYDPATEVLLTCGGAEAVNVAFMTTIDQGDEVIVFTPAFMNYENMIAEAGGVMVPIPLRAEDGFQINCGILEQHITPKTKMIVINNPCNPTGIVYSRQTLEGVAKLCVEHNILVFSDEIYNKIVHRHPARYAGAHHHHERIFQGLCHDRLENGLSGRPRRDDERPAEDPPVHHHLHLHLQPDRRGAEHERPGDRGRGGQDDKGFRPPPLPGHVQAGQDPRFELY